MHTAGILDHQGLSGNQIGGGRQPVIGDDAAFRHAGVSIDPDGRNLFEENKVTFNEKKDKALEEIYPQVSFIK